MEPKMIASSCRVPRVVQFAAIALCMIAPLRGDEPSTAAPKGKEAAEPSVAKEPSKIWLRLVKVDISKESPLRTDAKFNHPPYVYVTFTPKNGKAHSTSYYNGWNVEFPNDLDKDQVLVTTDKDNEYTFEVWDSQNVTNKKLFSVGPVTGADLQGMLKSVDAKDALKPKQLTLEDKKAGAAITLAFAGTRIWYRLKNITFPPESSHRTTLTSPPKLFIQLKMEGEQLGSRSGIIEGWSVDFPNKEENCWPIREGAPISYSIEVFNSGQVSSGLLLTVTKLSGTDFHAIIKEPIDKLLGPNAAAKIEFERCETEPR